MTASRPASLSQVDARGPCSKAGIRQLEQESDLTYPGRSQPSAPTHFPGCVVCAALRSFVKDLFSPGFTRKLQAGLISTLLTLTQVPHITFLLTPTSRFFLFLYLLVYSVQLGFVPCAPRSTFLEWKCCWKKKAGGYRLQGPSILPLVVLPVKCRPLGALSDSPPKYFPRCCPVSLLPHWDSKSLTQSPWVVSCSN